MPLASPQPALSEAQPMTAEAAVVPAESRYRWIGPEEYGYVFGRGKAAHVARLRFINDEVPEHQKEKRESDGAWLLRSDVLVLGRPLGELLQYSSRRGIHPLVAEKGTRKQQDREAYLNRWLDMIDDLAGERGFADSSPALFVALKERHGEYARKHNLPLGVSQVNELRARRRRDEPLCKLFNCGKKRTVLIDPEIFQECVALCANTQMDWTGKVSVYAWGEAEAAKRGVVWNVSRRRFAELVGDRVTRPQQALARAEDFEYRSKHVGKLRRPRDRGPCGKGASVDFSPDKVFTRLVGRDGRARPGRLNRAVLAYYGSDLVLVETVRTESADGAMRLLRKAYADDILENIDIDWGSGETRAMGKRRGVLATRCAEHVQRLTEYYGTTVVQMPVRHAWLKLSEPMHAQLRHIDKAHEFFVGSTAEEKKRAWKHALENIDRLPTPEQRAAEIQRNVELHNNSKSPALGNVTPAEYHADHRGEIRRPDPEFLEFKCSIFIGTRRVRQSGVILSDLTYGTLQQEVHDLERKTVWVWRPTGDRPPFLWLTDKAGHPLAKALLYGMEHVSGEELSQALAAVARIRKQDREIVKQRTLLLGTRQQQVVQTIYEHRMAAARARQAQRPAPEPAVRIVASGQEQAVRDVNQRAERSRVKRVLNPASERPSNAVPAAVERLAACAGSVPASEFPDTSRLPRRGLPNLEDPHRGDDDEPDRSEWPRFAEKAG